MTDSGSMGEARHEGRLFSGPSIVSLKSYFSHLKKNEQTLMRCGHAVTERLSGLGVAMVSHMDAAQHLVLQANQALAGDGWSYDLDAEEAVDGRYVLLACHDLYRLTGSVEAGVRVFKVYWSEGRWWGDHLTSHWAPYAWRNLPAAPPLPDAVMAAWQKHGFGKEDEKTAERLAQAGGGTA